jgi:hypothetical protein
VIAYWYSTIIYWTKFPWVLSFLKNRFSPFERRFPYACFCYEISGTALAGKFCVARGNNVCAWQKMRLSTVSFLSVYLSSVAIRHHLPSPLVMKIAVLIVFKCHRSKYNLVPRVSPSVLWERPWLRLVTCLPEGGKLKFWEVN